MSTGKAVLGPTLCELGQLHTNRAGEWFWKICAIWGQLTAQQTSEFKNSVLDLKGVI